MMTLPEAAPWRFQQVIEPIMDAPREHVLLRGRVLTARGNEAIEDGFVEFDAGIRSATSVAAVINRVEDVLVQPVLTRSWRPHIVTQRMRLSTADSYPSRLEQQAVSQGSSTSGPAPSHHASDVRSTDA